MKSHIHPKISILIPCYNHAAYIEKTIRSVWEQDYSNLELVIVDDGSTDNSCEIVSRLKAISPIKMIFVVQKNAGICRTLNHALELSSGEIIGILASDDVMLRDRLNQEIQYFESEPLLKVLYSNGQFLKPDGRVFGDLHKHLKSSIKLGIIGIREHMLSKVEGFYTQAMLIRRDFLLSLGKFDEETGSDDWSLNIRIFKVLKSEQEYVFLDRGAFLYRVHQTQSHRDSGYLQPIQRKVIRKYFSLKNRSKIICQNYVRQAFRLFFQRKFKLAKHYITMAGYIGFSKGFPLACLMRFASDFPGFAYRELMRRLKTK